jgi:hypothetical protein
MTWPEYWLLSLKHDNSYDEAIGIKAILNEKGTPSPPAQ